VQLKIQKANIAIEKIIEEKVSEEREDKSSTKLN
jgi:hypothetical protein